MERTNGMKLGNFQADTDYHTSCCLLLPPTSFTPNPTPNCYDYHLPPTSYQYQYYHSLHCRLLPFSFFLRYSWTQLRGRNSSNASLSHHSHLCYQITTAVLTVSDYKSCCGTESLRIRWYDDDNNNSNIICEMDAFCWLSHRICHNFPFLQSSHVARSTDLSLNFHPSFVLSFQVKYVRPAKGKIIKQSLSCSVL